MSDDSRWTITGNDGQVVVRIHVTHLNRIEDINEFGDALDGAINTHRATQVSLDLERVEYISSGILGWLAALSKRLRDQSSEGQVHLYRLQPLIDQLCRQICLDRAITIHPSDEAPPSI